MPAPERIYLGDSVYATGSKCDPQAFILTTENGLGPGGLVATNKIVIEPEVWESLVRWVEARARARALSS